MQTDVDQRVCDLEKRFEQLSCSVVNFQQAQTQQNQAVTQQIQTVDAKIDMEQQSLNVMLDNKLQIQMEKIEQLFAKRPRHE